MIDWDVRFNELARQGQIIQANEVLMTELGRILVTKKDEFVDLLNESGVNATTEMSDGELVDLYIENIDTNNDLMLGSSVLVNHWNQKSGYDGEDVLSDTGVKQGYGVLRAYYADPYQDEEYSNIIPILGAIGKGVKNLWQNRDRIKQGIQAYKGAGPQGGGGMPPGGYSEDMRKTDAQEAMLSSIIAEKSAESKAKQEQIDQQNKTTKTALYIAGGLGVTALIVTLVLVLKNKSKKSE